MLPACVIQPRTARLKFNSSCGRGGSGGGGPVAAAAAAEQQEQEPQQAPPRPTSRVAVCVSSPLGVRSSVVTPLPLLLLY